jgi:hypothetical protein
VQTAANEAQSHNLVTLLAAAVYNSGTAALLAAGQQLPSGSTKQVAIAGCNMVLV